MPMSLQLQTPVEPVFNAGNLVHTTETPGGFFSLTYVQELTLQEWEEWIHPRNRLRQLLVREGGKVLWDGRLEDITGEYDRDVGIMVTKFSYFGYFSKFNDVIDDTNHSSTTGQAIIASLASSAGLSASTEFHTASTTTISIDRTASDLSLWRTITDSDGLRDVPSSNGNLIDVYVYEDKKVHYVERVADSEPWTVSIQSGDIDFNRFESRWRDFSNSVAGRHSAGITAFSSDSVAQSRLSESTAREVVVGSTLLDTATATAIRDAVLEERKVGFLRIEDLRLSTVRDSNQARRRLCDVRAGHTIKILDLFPDANDTTVVLNKRNTFYITGTECIHGIDSDGEPFIELHLRLDVDPLELAVQTINRGA